MSSDRRIIAPWPGDDQRAYLQGGIESTGTKILWLSGTTATQVGGAAMHIGDIVKQSIAALDKTGVALAEAGYEWHQVVRLNWYVKSSHLDEFRGEANTAVTEYFARVGCKAPGVLLGVDSLAHPDMLVEFEATAVL